MTSFMVLLLATGFLLTTPALSTTPLQEATTDSDSKKDTKQDQAKTDRIPKWLKKLVHELEVGSPANRPDRIIRYKYRNEFVYMLKAGCCDQFSRVYDTSGKLICSTGGITGGGDGKCPEFFRERKDEKVIWEDKRARR
jgi:hypothetical protein